MVSILSDFANNLLIGKNKNNKDDENDITLYIIKRIMNDENKDIEKRRILLLSPLEREQELTKIYKKIGNREDINEISFVCIDLYGINVIKTLLLSFNNSISKNIKPFTLSGCSLLYSLAYKLLTNNKQELFDLFYKNTVSFLDNINSLLDNKFDYNLLDELGNTWVIYKLFVKLVYKIFNRLDDEVDADKIIFGDIKIFNKTIISTSLNLFYEYVFLKNKNRICDLVNMIINKERIGEKILRDKIKNCIHMIILMGNAYKSLFVKDTKYIDNINNVENDLTIYKTEMERKFLIETGYYYSQKYVLWNNDIFTYFLNVNNAINIESKRIDDYMHQTTKTKAIKIVLNELMLKHVEFIKQTLTSLFNDANDKINIDSTLYPDDCYEHFKYMFSCVLSVNKHYKDKDMGIYSYFISEFGKHLLLWSEKIKEIRKQFGEKNKELDKDGKIKKVNSSQADIDFINNCLIFYSRVNLLITNSFQTRPDLLVILEQTINNLMNTPLDVTNEKTTTCDPIEILVVFLDKLMKKTDSNTSNANIETTIKNSIKLFKHIRNKDEFIEHYRNLLGQRLLSGKSTSIDDEKNFIGEILLIQGSNFVTKIDAMVKDIILSGDVNKAFHEETNEIYKETLNFQILSSNWKLSHTTNVIIPHNIKVWINDIQKWYVKTYPATKILWNFKKGECVIKATYDKGKTFDLVMTPLHAIVLQLFSLLENNSELSFEEISEKSGITEIEVLKRILHSMTCTNNIMKSQILLKNTTENVITENDKFRVNANFSNPKRKIMLPMASLDVEEVDRNKHNQTINHERDLILQAYIVRIMKARKQFKHNDLIAEVVKQIINFKVDLKQVKKNIESLIEREYLKRDDDDSTLYTYLA